MPGEEPLRRYASAEALADDLRRWLDGQPISARPVSPIEHAWRWCRRRPVIASLIAALALTLVSGFVGTFALWRSSEAERGALKRPAGSRKTTKSSPPMHWPNSTMPFSSL